MMLLTVSPMNIGCRSEEGRPTLQSSVRAKMNSTSRNVPKPSAHIASGRLTVEMPASPGLG